jgi:Zn-dependent peptidase ImmA (M78 family)
MAGKDFQVTVQPSVLKWTASSAGYAHGELARRLGITEKEYQDWLDGKARPTLRQLERLAKVVRRPLAVFLLPEPPKELPPPKDFRMLPGREGRFDKRTILAIRRARRLQAIAKELMENIGVPTMNDLPKFTSSSDPIRAAERLRAQLGFDEAAQRRLRTAREVLTFLRERLEAMNILVFQFSMPVEDARGFTLVDDIPGVIVVNSRDQVEPRTFSLLHELGHVLLKESGVSLTDGGYLPRGGHSVEKWCNDFASAFLLPPEMAKRAFAAEKGRLTDTGTLARLSRTYKVSKAMLLYRMSRTNHISRKEYESVLKRYISSGAGSRGPVKGKKAFGQKVDVRVLSEKGHRFVSLVGRNIDKGLISHKDAIDYLSVKAGNLEKVLSKARQ